MYNTIIQEGPLGNVGGLNPHFTGLPRRMNTRRGASIFNGNILIDYKLSYKYVLFAPSTTIQF